MSNSVCQRCKRFEVDLTNASDSLNATDDELKASRQVISLLQRQLELFRIEKEGLEKLIIAQSSGSSPRHESGSSSIDNSAIQIDMSLDPATDESFKRAAENSLLANSGDIQKTMLSLIKTQLYSKDEEIVKLKYNLKQAQNEKEQLALQLLQLEEESHKTKSEISVLKENLALRDQTIVSLSNEVFEQGGSSEFQVSNQRRQSSFDAVGYQRNVQRTERQVAKLMETIDAYKKTNELLSSNLIKLTDRCDKAEKKEIESRSQCQELEAKCCQIQSKLLSLLKEIEQASKPGEIVDKQAGDSSQGQEVICSESVRLLIKRLLEDKSLDIPLSWKEGNRSKKTNDDVGFKYECDELGFYIPSGEEEDETTCNISSPISSISSRRNKLIENLASSAANQLQTVSEDNEDGETTKSRHDKLQREIVRQLSVDSTKTDEVRWRNAWDEFIKDFEQVDLSKCRRFKSLLRCGVPQEYRCKVWKSLVDLRIGKKRREHGPDYYQSLLEPNRPINETTKVKLNPSSKQIELDLLRTLPNNRYFETLDSSGTVRLRRVLTAYSTHNPKVGYCQGMNRLAAVALLVLPEEEAFWCLSTIVDDIMPPCYYNDLWLAQVDSNVVMDFVSLKMPELSNHFQRNAIELSLFAWFLTIFVDGTPPALFLRLWDSFLYEGDKVLFRVALALLKVHEPQLLKLNNSVAVNNYLRLIVNKPMNIDNFFEIAFEGINPFQGKAVRAKRQANFKILRAGFGQSTASTLSTENSCDRKDERNYQSDDSVNEDSSIISI